MAAQVQGSIVSDLGLTRYALIEGAVIGAVIFAILGEAAGWRRFWRAIAALLTSFSFSGVVVHAATKVTEPTPELQQAVAALVGVGGVYLVEAYLRMISRRSDKIVADALRRVLPRSDDA